MFYFSGRFWKTVEKIGEKKVVSSRITVSLDSQRCVSLRIERSHWLTNENKAERLYRVKLSPDTVVPPPFAFVLRCFHFCMMRSVVLTKLTASCLN